MSEKLFDALETCLQILEKGETIDSALARFPDLAEELRPIIEASLHAQTLAVADIPGDVQRRGRARLLQHASQMREAKRAPRRRTWLFSFRPVAVTLMLVVFFLSSTGLVRASNGALPGDNLYPVKRTWENVTLAFAPTQKRDQLKLTYETERVEEINELFTEGRSETVSFLGYVNQQAEDQWTVAGIRVVIDANTVLPTTPVSVGAAVMVTGRTDAQGSIVAQTIVSVAPGSIVPEIESEDHEDKSHGNQNDDRGEGNQNQSNDEHGNSNSSSGDDSGNSNGGEDKSKSKLEGILQTVSGTLWIVNGQNVDVSSAEIVGTAIPGAQVTVEGYYNAQGVFIATKITFTTGGSGSSDDSNSSDDNSDDNHDDDSSNDNKNDNNINDDNKEDNSNDSK